MFRQRRNIEKFYGSRCADRSGSARD